MIKKASIIVIFALLMVMPTLYVIPDTNAYTNTYGTISYNSGTNTITVTGNSSDGDAWSFYDIWHWCNVDPGGNASLVNSTDSNATHEGTQYYFNCKLAIGDGTTETWFKDTEKQVAFSNSLVSSSGWGALITIQADAHFQLGELYSSFYTEKGVSIFIPSSDYAGTFISSAEPSDAKFYGVYIKGNILPHSVWAYFPDNTTIYNSIFEGGIAIRSVGNIEIKNLYLLWKSYLYDVQGDIEDIISELSNFGVRNIYGSTIRNYKIYDAVSDVYMQTPLGNVTLIDCYSTHNPLIIQWYYSDDTQRDKVVFEKYTFNPIVTDTNGNPIEGATVNLYDSYGNLIFQDITDANGQINETVSYRKYQGNSTIPLGSASTDSIITTYSPHHLTITKSGYATYETNITIDHPIIDDDFVFNSSISVSTSRFISENDANILFLFIMSLVMLAFGFVFKVEGFKIIMFVLSGMLFMLIATLLSTPIAMIGIGLVGGVIMLLGVLEVITLLR